jgi:glycosyltransferase involved in cell wall biosynthesis
MGYSKRIWITWETQPRNIELSDAFCCEYAHFDDSSEPAPLRYLKSALRTVLKLSRSKYDLVFAQCPSLVLCVMVVLLRPFLRYRLVVDAHNAAIEYAESPSIVVHYLGRFVLRKADFVIVTNAGLARSVECFGGRPLILPDRLPAIGEYELPERFSTLEKPLVTLISTFASDEPIDLFVKAASEVSRPFTLIVTGKREKAGELLEYESERLIFSDFLNRKDYEGLIRHSDLVVDLTTREDCLVCGSYEALSARTPALLSDTAALRELFPKGFEFTQNSKEAYQAAITKFLDEPKSCSSDLDRIADDFLATWEVNFSKANKAIADSM